MAELLKGSAVAEALNEKTRACVSELNEKGVEPTLCIVRIGERPDDLSYERGALKRADAVGIKVVKKLFPEDVTEDELINAIRGINGDTSIHGVLLFRPLPPHINEARVCNALLPEKDVDGITDLSMAGVYAQKPMGYPPCTAQAVIELLDFYGIDLRGKNVTVIGRSLVIGKPVTMMLIKKNATVTVCHTKTVDTALIARRADVLVAAAGSAGMVNEGFVREGQTVVDVGINWSEEKQKIVGDVDFDAAEPIVEKLTPVPGGVGGVTTSVLMSHVADAARMQNGVELVPMTRELFHELFRGFQYDPDVFMDMELFERARGTAYDPEKTDARFDGRISKKDSMTFAVMLGERVIGEVVVKHIDRDEKTCELGIHLIDDSVKGRGFGTEAEKLAIEYAFNELGVKTVLADTILKNMRSRHILEKLGFEFTGEEEGFRKYRLDKEKYYADRDNR